MKFIEPEHRIGNEEVQHFGAAEIKNIGTPVFMFALSGIGMLVEMRSVEKSQAMIIFGKVARNPVQ
jgi:hypothetical protein